MTSKRQIPTIADRPSKRVKSATASSHKKPASTKASNKKSTNSLPRKPVRLDRLRWKEVALPDRLDDVEGFMGLEVIDDVEVVRKDDGLIEFRALEDAIEDEAVANGDGGGEDYEEWGGFGDDESAQEEKLNGTKDEDEHVEPEQAPAKNKKQKQKKKAKDPKANGTQNLKTNGDTPSNPFVALADENNEEDVPDLPEWEPLALSDATIRALSKLSYTSPTKIQSAAIPHIISGHDVIGKASTGSGKTLAFAIPIFEHWLSAAHSQPPSSSKIALDGEGDDSAANKGIKNTSEVASFSNPLTALIISPTRELAHQITSHITDLTSSSGLPSPPRTVSLTGGLSLQKQCRQLTQFGGADIVVATPGRLWEVLSSGKGFVEWFRKVRFLVVDEADRVLQDGHFKEVEDVVDLLVREDEDGIDGTENNSSNNEKNKHAKNRQTLVFSATFSRDLQQKLAKHSVRGHRNGGNKSGASGDGLMGGKETMEYLLQKLPFREDHPQMIDVNPVAQMAENLREGVVECGNMEKDLYLYFLLLRFPLRTLVFTNSISTVKRLSAFLSNLKLPAYPLHSSMIQKARLRSLERFASAATTTAAPKDGKASKTQQTQQPSVLISTDVAARGLDIKGVEMVVHYHVPRTADAYVHRSGRTARAEHRGVSVLLCSPDEAGEVRRLVARVHVQNSSSSIARELKTIPIDRTLVKRLKLRVELAQKITSSTLVQSAQRSESNWMKEAAEELGVDYDSDEFAAMGKKGKGGQRGKEKRRKAGAVTKDELAGMRAQLNEELKNKVGGGSRLYLTAGKDGENLAQRLVEGRGHDVFFGEEGGWGLKELLEA